MSVKDLSYSERTDALRQAAWRELERTHQPGMPYEECYVEFVYDGYAILCNPAQLGTYWRADYTITEGVQIAPRDTWMRVEREWAAKALLEQTLVNLGGELKSTPDGKVSGFLVRFTNPEDTDLTGDFFDDVTDYDMVDGQKCSIYYNHGMDPVLKRRKIGEGTLKKLDAGIWIEGQLALRDAYEKAINERLVQPQKAGWSSGTAAHLVEREQVGKAYRIKSWPLGLDASITPTPAEPRNDVLPLKSFVATEQSAPQAPAETAGEAVAGAVAAAPVKTTPVVTIVETPREESSAMPMDLTALEAKMDRIETFLQRFEQEPALQHAGIVSASGGTADPNIKTFSDFLMAIRRNDVKRLEEHYKSVKTLSENDATAGGYTVPTEFVNDLLQLAGDEPPPVRPRAYKHPMTTREAEIPALDQSQTPTAGTNSALFAGVTARWTEEGGVSTETEPKFRMMRLIAHELTGHTKATASMRADSGLALEALLKKLFGGAVLWTENYAFIRGNGVGKPLGAVGAQNPAGISIARTGGGNSFELADAKAMKKRLYRGSAKRAIWLMHPFIESDLIDLALSGNTLVTYMPSLREAPPLSLLGIPIVFDDSMSAPGTAGDVALCDFSHYVIGDRQELAIAMSEHADFTNGRTVWRFTYRVDGQPWMNAPYTLADGVNTVSPFIYLT